MMCSCERGHSKRGSKRYWFTFHRRFSSSRLVDCNRTKQGHSGGFILTGSDRQTVHGSFREDEEADSELQH